MTISPTYEERALAVARCVYARVRAEEPAPPGPDGKSGWVMTIDNLSSSGLQVATGVLTRLDLLNPLDDNGRRSAFTCAPGTFESRIAKNRANGCPEEALDLALVCLLELYPDDDGVFAVLSRLGVCEAAATNGAKSGEREIKWTEKKEAIDRLYKDWPALVEG